MLDTDGKIIYHAGDTDFISEMNGLGKIDIAFLPIGGTFTMDVKEAAEATSVIKPKIVIPMHYLKADPQDFQKKVEALSKVKVKILRTGEVINL